MKKKEKKERKKKERRKEGKKDEGYLSECMIGTAVRMGRDSRVLRSIEILEYFYPTEFKTLVITNQI